ncbi:MAG: GatB/YqeY domain-containing protein [SAR202 cluster bacterium]|jgi:hypothetical protein|nr:GatB/YqeY domain-containing protein [SAR202 cluster bacterium]
MTLQEKLQQDLKDSMRSGDTARRDVIRFLRSAIHNQEIASQGELDDEGVIAVLSKQALQRRDSIEIFKEGNRLDLVEKEEAQLAIIGEYLPTQLTEDEISTLVHAVVKETGASGPRDMGKVMSRLMPDVKGKADGRAVSRIVQELLRSVE